ncbi:phosphoglycerol geranylgeranyltransferase [Flavobacterium soli]|uniref:geranylgeranylglyceryl/heptaprenylglyceryl phosphate synthase n=1 Tax=Flavobacterium soli TaxID=344881 RepID=UPI00041AAEEB|nr:geranylgeranylglyceryl/heptaprenylglyceryl phosphate synthase [Flavobacterium soli]
MKNIYSEILKAKTEQRKLLAILLDPDKIVWEGIDQLISKIDQSPATHVFIGGSLVFSKKIDDLILKIKANSNLPIVLFPGNPSQISNHADGILFLSLISGRNPDYLIEHQVKAAPILKKTNLEIIPTGYILIESGNETAVAKISQTTPISRNDEQEVLDTAQAGEMLGNKLIYLEAGSGAHLSVPAAIIQLVSQNIEIPMIVGGGIKSKDEIELAYASGADLVVIGTAFEKDNNFFNLNL